MENGTTPEAPIQAKIGVIKGRLEDTAKIINEIAKITHPVRYEPTIGCPPTNKCAEKAIQSPIEDDLDMIIDLIDAKNSNLNVLLSQIRL